MLDLLIRFDLKFFSVSIIKKMTFIVSVKRNYKKIKENKIKVKKNIEKISA